MPKNMLHLLPKLGPEGIERLAKGMCIRPQEVPLLKLETVQRTLRGSGWETREATGCQCDACLEAYRVCKIILKG